MSREKFEDDCKGCEPAMIDTTTGKMLPVDHPAMVAIKAVWQTLTEKEKIAFHNVCCLNSRNPEEISVFGVIQERMTALAKQGN